MLQKHFEKKNIEFEFSKGNQKLDSQHEYYAN